MYTKHNIAISAAMFLLFTVNYAGSDRIILDGNFMQGGLVYGQVAPGSKVTINNHAVRVSSNGEFILGFGRDYPAETILTIQLNDGSEDAQKIYIAERNYSIQRIDGLPDKKVNPDPEALKRIQRESREIARARSIDDDRIDFNTNFIWPAKGPISGVYGSQRVLNGQARRPHFGIDIAAPVGTTVIAPAAGVVTYVNDDMYFSGGTLVLDHGHNLTSSFLHLHKIFVQVGDRVEQGQEIAQIGETGRVTGPHLDWRMNWHQQRLDPGLLMNEKPDIK